MENSDEAHAHKGPNQAREIEYSASDFLQHDYWLTWYSDFQCMSVHRVSGCQYFKTGRLRKNLNRNVKRRIMRFDDQAHQVFFTSFLVTWNIHQKLSQHSRLEGTDYRATATTVHTTWPKSCSQRSQYFNALLHKMNLVFGEVPCSSFAHLALQKFKCFLPMQMYISACIGYSDAFHTLERTTKSVESIESTMENI